MTKAPFEPSREYAAGADSADDLREFRNEYHIPEGTDGQPIVYFTGNSLGLQPRNAAHYVKEVMDAWHTQGVNAHFEGPAPWLKYTDDLNANMALLVGAKASEVVLMNGLTVNLHLLLASFFRPSEARHKILIERDAFPSDKYAVASHARWHGLDPKDVVVHMNPEPGQDLLQTANIIEYLDKQGHEVALVMLGGINYYSGQLVEMAQITAAAHRAGCICGFDLAHAAGNVPLQLHDWGVDFAAWCTYKYLNAGPGSPGGVFIHEKHHSNPKLPALTGWWGQDVPARFRMADEYQAAPGADAWQISNPSILSLAPLRASLAHFISAGPDRLVAKSRHLTSYLEYLIRERLGNAIEIISPGDPAQRGAQLSIRVTSNPRGVFEQLIKRDVLCDWREPSMIRMAPVPLYNSYMDVYRAVQQFDEAIRSVSETSLSERT